MPKNKFKTFRRYLSWRNIESWIINIYLEDAFGFKGPNHGLNSVWRQVSREWCHSKERSNSLSRYFVLILGSVYAAQWTMAGRQEGSWGRVFLVFLIILEMLFLSNLPYDFYLFHDKNVLNSFNCTSGYHDMASAVFCDTTKKHNIKTYNKTSK